MKRVEFQWPDDLVGWIDRARGDVSRSKFVRRALESALAVQRAESPLGVDQSAETPASSRTSAPVDPGKLPGVTRGTQAVKRQQDVRSAAWERQRKLNEGKEGRK